MNKCVVKILKTIFPHESTQKPGTLIIKVKPNLNNVAVVLGTEVEGESIIELISGTLTVTKTDGTLVSLPYPSAKTTSIRKWTTGVDGAVIVIHNKYALSHVNFIDFAEKIEVNALKYCQKLQRLIFGQGTEGNLNNLSRNIELTAFGVNEPANELYADGLDFLENIKIAQYGLHNVRGDIQGSIDNVNSITTYLNFGDNRAFPNISFTSFKHERTEMLVIYKANLGNSLETYLTAISLLEPISGRDIIVNGSDNGNVSSLAATIREHGFTNNIIINGVSY
jgi:hypothetical protein